MRKYFCDDLSASVGIHTILRKSPRVSWRLLETEFENVFRNGRKTKSGPGYFSKWPRIFLKVAPDIFVLH